MEKLVVKLTEEENIVLSARLVHRLTETKSGDACLLYLWLRRSGDAMDEAALREKLAWDAGRFEKAKKKLADAGLVRLREAQEKRETPEAPVRSEQLPEYSDEDVARCMEDDSGFARLLRETERKLGPLPTAGVKMLLGLRDHLGLPDDVIYLLVNDCIAQKEARFGAGRRPTMREIEKEGYAWARRELFSVRSVDEYLKRRQARCEQYPAYQAVLQLGARPLSASEEKYVAKWIAMGFPPETLAIAYDKTVLRCHEFKWPYCDGIMKKWHEKGLHTPPEVLSENGSGKAEKKDEEKKTVSRKAGMSRYI